MCTRGTLLHPTYGTRTLWGLSLSPSDLWDLMACMSLMFVDPSPSDLWDSTAPFSIFIWPMGPNGLRVMCTRGTIQPLGSSGLRVRCTCGIFLHLHSTYGTQWLACHLLPLGFNKFKIKKTMRPRSQTQDPEQGIDHLHHCATCLIVLTCLWCSICSLCGQVDLYIGYIPILLLV
jgi:hypothetical protein